MNSETTGHCPTCLSCRSLSRKSQLTEYFETNGLLPLLHSAYRRHHSTETALLKVLSDVQTATDDKKVSLWPRWTSVLPLRGQRHFTVQAAVQVWPRWCRTGVDPVFPRRYNPASLFRWSSVRRDILRRLSAGSTLGPLLFLLHMAELSEMKSSRLLD